MPRERFKYDLTDNDLETIEKNGIPMSTVYARLKRGWDVDTAVTKPSRPVVIRDRNPDGEITTDTPKGKGRFFKLPATLDDDVDAAIEASGLSAAQWYVEAVELKLESSKNKAKR